MLAGFDAQADLSKMSVLYVIVRNDTAATWDHDFAKSRRSLQSTGSRHPDSHAVLCMLFLVAVTNLFLDFI